MNVMQLLDYENGELDNTECLKLFGELIASGDAWTLQGSYGRTAQSLIDAQLIDSAGVVDYDRALDIALGGEL